MADDTNFHHAVFRYDDGGMRALACGVVWCGLVYHCNSLPKEELMKPQVVELARRLLAVPCFFRNQGDETSAMIRRIIKQNIDAKKLPISSFEWSQILRKMQGDGEKLTVQEAINMYNANPQVSAHGGSSSKEMTEKIEIQIWNKNSQ